MNNPKRLYLINGAFTVNLNHFFFLFNITWLIINIDGKNTIFLFKLLKSSLSLNFLLKSYENYCLFFPIILIIYESGCLRRGDDCGIGGGGAVSGLYCCCGLIDIKYVILDGLLCIVWIICLLLWIWIIDIRWILLILMRWLLILMRWLLIIWLLLIIIRWILLLWLCWIWIVSIRWLCLCISRYMIIVRISRWIDRLLSRLLW